MTRGRARCIGSLPCAVTPATPPHPTTPRGGSQSAPLDAPLVSPLLTYSPLAPLPPRMYAFSPPCVRLLAAGVQRVADNVPGVRGCMDGDAAELVMRRLSSHGTDSAACRADRSRGKEAPFDRAPLSPSSVTERRIQTHSGGAADEAGLEVVGDVAALTPTTLHPSPSLSLLALPAELLTLVAEQLDAHCD